MGNKSSKQEEEKNGGSKAKVDDASEGSINPQASSKEEVEEEFGPLTKEEVEAASRADVDAREEVLVKIPDALVHLIDDQQSVLLASGEFALSRLLQDGNEIVIIARVGKDLKWPVVKDEVVTKLDSAHYSFSIKVDPRLDKESSGEAGGDHQEQRPEVLNYGVTFNAKRNGKQLAKLDGLLARYSLFSEPKMVQGTEEEKKKAEEEGKEGGTLLPASIVKDMEAKPSEEKSRLYWTAVAPNVEDYSSSIAKGIASGTGQVIRGLFWCSNATVEQLEKGGEFLKRHSKAGEKPAEIGPRTMQNMKRVRNMTRMTEQVARGILGGIIKATGFFTTAAVTSKVGKKFFKMVPGEVALASLDAFAKVFDALEMAGESVLSTSTLVTTGIVSHKFGDQAAEFAHEGMSSVGHLLSTAWVISKIRKAINPKAAQAGTTGTRGMLKSAAKAAVGERRT